MIAEYLEIYIFSNYIESKNPLLQIKLINNINLIVITDIFVNTLY